MLTKSLSIMSKTKIVIAFKNLHLLWSFVQRIHVVNIEINTADKILICECAEKELDLLDEYEGMVVEEYRPKFPAKSLNQ